MGDNTGGGAVKLRPIRFQCIRVGISGVLLCILHVWLSPCTLSSDLHRTGLVPDLPESNCCLSRGLTCDSQHSASKGRKINKYIKERTAYLNFMVGIEGLLFCLFHIFQHTCMLIYLL